MKSRASLPAALVAVMSMGAVQTVDAHHSFPSTYLIDKVITIKGKVTEFMFRNPHSVLQVLAPGDDGKMYRWAVEWAAAAALERDGKATRDLLHPGDEVVVTGAAGRNPEDHKIRLYSIERHADGWKWEGKFD
jgi:hypothetical protein